MKLNTSRINLNNYGYIIAIANIREKHDRSTPSHYHWKILKCRMVIFSNSSILASPDKKDLQHIHLIFNKTGDDYDKLNSLLIKFSLVQEGGIRTTTPESFQMCFYYTMTAKIAPTWNILGENYLINNRHFLITKGPQEGVQCNISVNDQHILSMELKSVKINLMYTEEVFYPGEWIRVLPSLNKAMVEEYYESFAPMSKFNCYKDLRRHWKNIHGYRLPEEEGSFYTIQFWRGEPLIYPKICVNRNFPIITPTPKSLEKIIIQRFLDCFNAKMSNFIETSLTIQDIDDEVDNATLGLRQIFPDTQAVSLCTPTQGISYNFSDYREISK